MSRLSQEEFINQCKHYKPVKLFGGMSQFNLQKKLDEIKNRYCEENNIYLLRIPYTDYKNIEEILKKENIIN